VRDTLPVGLAQWRPEPGAPDLNLATALGFIARLADDGAELIVLPELWPCGYEPTTLASDATAAAEPLDGPRMERMRAIARDRGVWLAPGSVPEAIADGIANTATLIDPAGEIRAVHRKAHLYGPHERAAFAAGDRTTVVETEDLGTVGLCVCFDGDFPETARAMRAAGARLVLSPCAYETAAETWWDRLYPAHALVNGQWWVLANQAGANPSVTLLGGSVVLSPFGDAVVRAPRVTAGERSAPAAICVTVPLAMELARADDELAILWDERRPEIYATMGSVQG
jgi:predicted amidohydrolase